MNYNVQISPEQYVLHTQEDHYEQNSHEPMHNKENQILEGKYKKQCIYSSKQQPVIREKENQPHNNINFNKNIHGINTNHSFNGLFNQNANILKGSKKESKGQIQFCDTSNNQNYIKNKSYNNSSFISSGKLSNFQFITDSSKSLHQNQIIMHSQTEKFVIKYFPDNYNNNQFYGQYITLNDFVEVLFQEYEDLIGKQYNLNLLEEFTNKIFLIFGQQIYFQDLFEKTLSNGMIGLILQAFKAIQQEQNKNKNIKFSNQNKTNKFPINDSRYRTNQTNLNKIFNNITKNQSQSRLTMDGSLNSQQTKIPTTKISLDKYFSNQNSKINILDCSSNINQEDLEDIKLFLSDYIEQMYQEAQKKICKKYLQEFKKISFKYKQTQKILEKINQKITNHYDTLSTVKDYEKKVKLLKQKQIQLENKIKNLELECKSSKDEVQKQKLNGVKLQQEIQKLNKKMQKYQNAIFEKAMQKNNNLNNLSTSQIKNFTIIPDQQQKPNVYGQIINEKPKIQFKIDTFTQHRPIGTPIISNIRSYSPYVSRQIVYPTTPQQTKQPQRVTISPYNKRISFNKTQNTTNLNNMNSLNQNLQISTVQRVQIGDPIILRPTSPIGKLQPVGLQYANQKINSNSQFSQSRITSISPIRR